MRLEAIPIRLEKEWEKKNTKTSSLGPSSPGCGSPGGHPRGSSAAHGSEHPPKLREFRELRGVRSRSVFLCQHLLGRFHDFHIDIWPPIFSADILPAWRAHLHCLSCVHEPVTPVMHASKRCKPKHWYTPSSSSGSLQVARVQHEWHNVQGWGINMNQMTQDCINVTTCWDLHIIFNHLLLLQCIKSHLPGPVALRNSEHQDTKIETTPISFRDLPL